MHSDFAAVITVENYDSCLQEKYIPFFLQRRKISSGIYYL